jgi:tetratricopeptide (TPR) repeat protein
MLTEAIALDPNFADAMARLANLNAGRIAAEGASKAEAALAWANKALAVDPSSDGAYITLTGIYWQLGRLASSRAAFQRALIESKFNWRNGQWIGCGHRPGPLRGGAPTSRRACCSAPTGFVFYPPDLFGAIGRSSHLNDGWKCTGHFPSDKRLIDIEIDLRLINKRTDEALAIAQRAADQPNQEARAMLAELPSAAGRGCRSPHRDPQRSGAAVRQRVMRSPRALDMRTCSSNAARRRKPVLDQAQTVEALVADGNGRRSPLRNSPPPSRGFGRRLILSAGLPGRLALPLALQERSLWNLSGAIRRFRLFLARWPQT